MEFMKVESEVFYVCKDGLILEDRDYVFLSLVIGDKIIEVIGLGDVYVLLLYFGKFNYLYVFKYLVLVILCYDGFFKFGVDNCWVVFLVFFLGWRIKNELFFENVDFFLDLKLRFSWGCNGNLVIYSGYL